MLEAGRGGRVLRVPWELLGTALCCGCPLKAKAAKELEEQLGRNWECASELELWAARTHGIPALLLLLQLRRLPALPPPSLDLLSVGAERFDKPNETTEEKRAAQ